MTLRRSYCVYGVIGVAVSVASAGCGRSNHPTSPVALPASSSATSASASPGSAESAAALAVYNAAVADWVRAGTTADNHDPRLGDHAIGQALTTFQLALAEAKSSGLHFDGTPKDNPQVKELLPPTAPTQVFIVSCLDATNWIARNADGSVVETGPNGKHRVEALVTNSAAGWKLTRMLIRAVGTC